MEFIEQDFYFSPLDSGKQPLNAINSPELLKGAPNGSLYPEAEAFGIRIRLGNRPLVYSFSELMKCSGKEFVKRHRKTELYAIVHAIGAIPIKGKGKVKSLFYEAEMLDEDHRPLDNAATIQLIPNTRFKDVLKSNIELGGVLSASGQVSEDEPKTLLDSLISKVVSWGSEMKIKLSASTEFIGSFTFSLKHPVVLSTGEASSTCAWQLYPNEEKNPLLGDQTLIQIISVPVHTKSISYRIKGIVSAQKGVFFKNQTETTDTHIINVELSTPPFSEHI